MHFAIRMGFLPAALLALALPAHAQTREGLMADLLKDVE
jgi:hypothetical protein